MRQAMFVISVLPPFRLDLTAWVLRRRAKNTIDQWDGTTYSRVLVIDDTPVKVAVSYATRAHHVAVRLQSRKRLSAWQQATARAVIEKMFGLTLDLRPFYEHAVQDPTLEQLSRQFAGVRPARFPSVFEALINAIACQQVSLDAGISLLNRLCQAYGLCFPDGPATLHAFPRPEDLLAVDGDNIRQLGFSYQKAQAIKGLVFSIANGDIQLEQLEDANNEDALAYLRSIRGIGRWSAEYVLLRGLGRLDIFPGDDIGGQNNVQQLLGLAVRPGYEQLGKLTASWHPYAGFVYFHLLLEKLYVRGLI